VASELRTPVEAGVRTLPLSLASPLGATLAGRFGAGFRMPPGMALRAGVRFGLLTWSTDSSHATMWPPFVARGLGAGMVMAASCDALVCHAPARGGGVAGGLRATILRIGGGLSTSVPVPVINARVGSPSAASSPRQASPPPPPPPKAGRRPRTLSRGA
jgi:hypothetical protein